MYGLQQLDTSCNDLPVLNRKNTGKEKKTLGTTAIGGKGEEGKEESFSLDVQFHVGDIDVVRFKCKRSVRISVPIKFG